MTRRKLTQVESDGIRELYEQARKLRIGQEGWDYFYVSLEHWFRKVTADLEAELADQKRNTGAWCEQAKLLERQLAEAQANLKFRQIDYYAFARVKTALAAERDARMRAEAQAERYRLAMVRVERDYAADMAKFRRGTS